LKLDFVYLKICNAVLRLRPVDKNGKEIYSSGADQEVELAIKEGIPASELKAKKAVVASNNSFKLQPSDKNKVFLYNYI
jgi:hypothetical protein